ncbi:MAG: hypothetical protein RMK29_12225 [Myxococcales bacterium]|nr:hypothetical protein [Myxococcota bacterium]MDW8282471.1 hypothetical protein [Myxococcales bacterium]
MRSVFCLLVLALLGFPLEAPAQEGGDAPPAPYDLLSLECGELDQEAGLLPLRPNHIAGEDMDLLCKAKVQLSPSARGTPRPHTVSLSVVQGKKTTYQQVRDTRLLAPGTRTILFVIPAERLPSDSGKVVIRAELSKPASKPSIREVSFEINAED